jgi:DNA transposition AAA+ family ATPase
VSDVVKLPHRESQDKPVIVETPTVQAIVGFLRWLCARPHRRIGVIVGAPGIGKTTALSVVAKQRQTIVITLNPQHARLLDGLWLLAEKLRAASRDWSRQATQRYLAHRIIEEIRELQRYGLDNRVNSRLLVVVDEAQHADDALVEAFRAIQDATGCALVFVGNPTFRARLNRQGFEQVLSRVNKTLPLPGVQPGDVAAICEAHGVVGKRAYQLLEGVAARATDSLRRVCDLIEDARDFVGADKSVDEKAIAAAIEQLR